ncbi:uncharacterized protein Dwil_GK14336 [Drosophila willistoni]|uniref:Uncharacterized protein n=1 Tax=Drosophila willistoni TaxID=7260 RepID=B4MI90_DROWI|nr:uncharacterized protein Dwil_GK14336 [Drosophila willistoni]
MASKDFVDSHKCSKVDNGGCQNKTQCSPKSIAKPKKEKEEPFQFHHLLKQPAECCADPCPERFPTFDECLYKESDKAARKYQVAWVECPPIQIKPKKICCFEKGKRPPIPRRKRKEPKAKCEEEVQCPEEGYKPSSQSLCDEFGLDTGGILEDLRNRFREFASREDHYPEVLSRLAEIEAQFSTGDKKLDVKPQSRAPSPTPEGIVSQLPVPQDTNYRSESHSGSRSGSPIPFGMPGSKINIEPSERNRVHEAVLLGAMPRSRNV